MANVTAEQRFTAFYLVVIAPNITLWVLNYYLYQLKTNQVKVNGLISTKQLQIRVASSLHS